MLSPPNNAEELALWPFSLCLCRSSGGNRGREWKKRKRKGGQWERKTERGVWGKKRKGKKDKQSWADERYLMTLAGCVSVAIVQKNPWEIPSTRRGGDNSELTMTPACKKTSLVSQRRLTVLEGAAVCVCVCVCVCVAGCLTRGCVHDVWGGTSAWEEWVCVCVKNMNNAEDACTSEREGREEGRWSPADRTESRQQGPPESWV